MPPTYQWRREDYNRTAKLEEFLPWFRDWTFDWLDVPGLIRNRPRAYEYPLVDRDPVAQWTFGLTTLMGDAAHPMYPVGSSVAGDPRCPRHHPRDPGARRDPCRAGGL
jgi:2-polyprenyl-6-methoxyphenol hydroxylase-like FAD-dependent oxidoreductase